MKSHAAATRRMGRVRPGCGPARDRTWSVRQGVVVGGVLGLGVVDGLGDVVGLCVGGAFGLTGVVGVFGSVGCPSGVPGVWLGSMGVVVCSGVVELVSIDSGDSGACSGMVSLLAGVVLVSVSEPPHARSGAAMSARVRANAFFMLRP